jgi:S-formylglutathione hydrolase FrmB
MNLCEIRWRSEELRKQVATLLLLPDTAKPPFATFYLLHGLSDDQTIWMRQTRIEVYAAQYPFIVVMPDGFRSFYTNNDAGPAYARYIGEELPAMIERNFPARADRASRAVGGLSMGGYGALRIALGYPDRFISATSHGGSMMCGSRATPPDRFVDAERIFGKHPQGTDHDLIHLAEKAKAAGPLPRIRMDVGTSDALMADNREFHAALQKLDIPHEYEEFPGEHNWDFADLHVREALAFHAKAMNL